MKEAEETIDLKTSECSQWKERCEARSPDEALSQQVEAALATEKELHELNSTLVDKEQEFSLELEQKQSVIDKLSSDLDEMKKLEENRREETSSLHEELSALASAYSNLEDEFRRDGKEEVLMLKQQLELYTQRFSESEEKCADYQQRLSSLDSHTPFSTLSDGDNITALLEEEVEPLNSTCKSKEEQILKLESLPKEHTNHGATSLLEKMEQLKSTCEGYEDQIEKLEGLHNKHSDHDVDLLLEEVEQWKRTCKSYEEQIETMEKSSNDHFDQDKDALLKSCEEQTKKIASLSTDECEQIDGGNDDDTLVPFEGAEELRSLCESYKGQINKLEAEVMALRSVSKSASADDARGQDDDETIHLKDELERLQSTCRAADEWMAMAVARMQAMGAQNAELLSELQSLKSNKDHGLHEKVRVLSNDLDESLNRANIHQREAQELRHELEKVQNQLVSSLASNTELQNKLSSNELVEGNFKLENAAENEKDGILSALKAEKDAILKEKDDEVTSLNLTIKRIDDSLRSATDALNAKDLELKKIQTGFAAIKTSNESKDIQLRTLKENCIELQQAAVEDKRFYEKSLELKEVEVEQRNVALENSSKQSLEMKKLQEKLDAANASNEAATEWMQQAVLNQQQASEQASTLSAKIEELRAKCATESNSDEKLGFITRENDALRVEVNQVADRCDKLVEEKLSLEEINTVLRSDKANLENGVVSLEKSLSSLRGEYAEKELIQEEAFNNLKEDLAASENKVLKLQSQVNELEGTRQDIDDRSEELRDMTARLYTLEQEKGRTEIASQEFERVIAKLQSELTRANESIGICESRTADLSLGADNDRTTISGLNAQIESLTNAKEALSEELTEIEASCKTKNDEDAETILELTSKLKEFSDWSEMVQDKITSLEEERDEASDRVVKESKNVGELQQLVNRFKEENSSLQHEIEVERKEIKVQVEEMKDNFSREKDAIATERESFSTEITSLTEEKELLSATLSSVEAELKSIIEINQALAQEKNDRETEINEQVQLLLAAAEKLDQTIAEKEEALVLAEEEIVSLSNELDETIERSKQVVDQWKGNVMT